MKKLLLLLALFLPAVMAYGSQAVGTVNISSTTGGDAVAPSMTNTAGNFLFSYAWVSCTSTNPNTTFAYQVNDGTPNQDSNGNLWNQSTDSTYAFTSTTRAIYFFWTPASINGGANVVTYKNQASDCQIKVGIQSEYAGFVAWNTGSYRVNGSFMPFSTPDANTTFPINANATYLVTPSSSPDITVSVSIAEGGTCGTWSANGTWSQVTTATANGTCMTQYDGVTGTSPTTIQIGNTGSSFTHAVGEWTIFNRVVPPSPGYTVTNCGQINSGNVASCSYSYTEGDVAILQTGGNASIGGNPGLTTPTSTGCPSNWVLFTDVGLSSLSGNFYYFQVMHGSGTCTVTETTTGATGLIGIQVVNVQGLPNYAIDTLGIPATIGGGNQCSVSGTSSVDSDVIVALTAGSEGPPAGTFMVPTSLGWNANGYADGSFAGQGIAMQGFTNRAGSAGTQTFGAVNIGEHGTSAPSCALFLLRSTPPPSMGFMQGSFITGSAMTLPLTLPYKSLAGDHIRVALEGTNITIEGYGVTIAGGPTCIRAPSVSGTTGDMVTFDCPVLSDSASPLTISATISSSSPLFDMMAWEASGFSASHWLASSTAITFGSAGGSCPLTPLASGPIYLRRPATYYLDAILQGGINPTGNTGFYQRLKDQTSNFPTLTGMFDQVATIAAPTTFNSQPNVTGTQGAGCGGGLWAWSNVPYTDPETVQTSYDTGELGTDTLAFNEPTSSCAVILTGGSQVSGSSWSVSSSPSLTWSLLKAGTSSDLYGMWANFNVPAGALSVTTSNGTGILQSTAVKVCNLTGVNSAVGSTASGGSVGPISISTLSDAQYIVSAGIASGASGGTQIAYTSPQTWTLKQYGNGDSIGVQVYDFLTSTPGTYGITFTSNGVPTPPSNMSGVMTNFDTPPFVQTGQPFVNLITKNESNLGVLGAQ